tara:strand:+ start:38 stop:643 length:606 start_codon:yes stop_codon:yes gene_type:complete
MLYEELRKVAPPLASFLQEIAPDLGSTEVDVRKPKGIPRSRRFVGKCYMFSYRNPEGKGTKSLPYYHMFPMVINLEQRPNTMLGLNPFYLPPQLRTDLIENLLSRLDDDIENEDARSKITYKMIAKYRRSMRHAFPCIKQYTHKRMGSVAIEMKPSLWREFYLGDISKKFEIFFRGGSPRTVWSDSRRKSIEQGRDRRKKQ